MKNILWVIAVGLSLASSLPGPASEKPPIRLKARVFAPEAGVEPAVAGYFARHRGRGSVHVMMQFTETPDLGRRASLRASRVTLLNPIPERTFFVAMPPDAALARRLAGREGLARWIGVIQLADKISPEVAERLRGNAPATGADAGADDVIVQFFADVTADQRRRVLAQHGARVVEELSLIHGLRATMARRSIGGLAADDAVRWIAPPPPQAREFNDGIRSATGVNVDFAPGASLHDPPYDLTGFNIVVGLWETTHVSLGHPDLNPRVVRGDALKPLSFEVVMRHSENVAANGLFDPGETIYLDNDDNRVVTPGQDDRLSTWYGPPPLGAAAVQGPDDDVGEPLSMGFVSYERYDGTQSASSAYSDGDPVYYDTNQSNVVDQDDRRLMNVPGAGGPGSFVVCPVPPGQPDPDCGRPLTLFPSVTAHQHSTMMAGTIIGDGTQSAVVGAPDFHWKGVAPRATMVSYDLWSSLTADYLDAAARGVALSNNSWGWLACNKVTPPATCYDTYSELFDAVVSGRDDAGSQWGLAHPIQTFGAAGNDERPERYVDLDGDWFYDDQEPIYVDSNDDGLVSPSEPLIAGVLPPGAPTTLTDFTYIFKHDETGASAGSFQPGEGIYVDVNVNGFVDLNDVRITPPPGLPTGPVTDPLAVDLNRFLRPFRLWGTIQIPNSSKNTIEVANITSDTKKLSFATGRGPTDDGRLKPELSAPGDQEIPTPDALGTDYAIRSLRPPDGYNAMVATGTSSSTAATTGVAALLLERYQIACAYPDPLPEVLRALLIHGAEDLTAIPNLAASYVGPDFSTGFGRVDAKHSVDMIAHHRTGSLNPGAITNYYVTVGKMGQLRATLAWDDPPFTANAAPSPVTGILQNDLDVMLIAPNGTQYTPWLLNAINPMAPAYDFSFAAGVAVPDTARDRRNTIEQVVVNNAAAGVWTIRVMASTLNLPPQSFAIVSEALPPENGPCLSSPPADVWMKDNAADTGEKPSAGAPASPDILNLNAPDDPLVDQPVIYNQPNYLYVILRNANSQASARPVTVDVWSTTSAAPAWPATFQLLARAYVPLVSAGGTTLVGPIAWTPPAAPPPNGVKVYVRVQSQQDPIGNGETLNVPNNIRASNNITGRLLQ